MNEREHPADVPVRGGLKSLLKKPGQTRTKSHKNRVVINEKLNEFFAADYIILIKEECCTDYEEECDCCCQEPEMIRLGNCKECRADLTRHLSNNSVNNTDPRYGCNDPRNVDVLVSGLDCDPASTPTIRRDYRQQTFGSEESQEEEDDEDDDDEEEEEEVSESEDSEEIDKCEREQNCNMPNCVTPSRIQQQQQQQLQRPQQQQETLSPPEGYKDVCDEDTTLSGDQQQQQGRLVCGECNYYHRQRTAATSADRVSDLEKLLNAIDGMKSPTKILAPEKLKDALAKATSAYDAANTQEHIIEDVETEEVVDNQMGETAEDGTRRNNGKARRKISDATNQTLNPNQDALGPGVPSTSTIRPNDKSQRQKLANKKQLPSTSDSEAEENESVLSGVNPLSGKRPRTKLYGDKSNDSKQYGKTLLMIQRELKKIRKNQKSHYHRDDCYSSKSSDDEMVEIGFHGSNVYVTDDQWKAAKAARSYTAMGLTLLLAAFPMDVLLRSNLRGGPSKNKGKENADTKYKALDPKILEAIYCAVRRRWKAYSKVGLGVAINNKLTYLRSQEKKKNPI